MRFKDKVAIVTGGASGIGRATAELFAREGASVVIADINMEAAQGLAERLSSAGCPAIALEADSADQDAILGAVKAVRARFGRIDILVNNAGIAHSKPALDYAVWDPMIAVDLSGPFHWSRAVARESMVTARSGAIVNVASLAGLGGYAGDVGYIAAKHGLVGLTKSLAIEWAQYGIRVNCVCPGLTETPILTEVKAMDPNRFDGLDRSTPLGRITQPIEQARAIAFLSSDDASAITGVSLPVDGGLTAMLAGQSPPAVAIPIACPPA